MKKSISDAIKKQLPEADYPAFQPGDKIRVETREEIGGQQRRRFFEGVCIDRKGEGPNRSFTVRKDSFGVGVERVFPLHSPAIEEIKIIRKGIVRRAKLSYLAEKSSRDARIKERRANLEELNRNASGKAVVVEKEEDESSEAVEPSADAETAAVEQSEEELIESSDEEQPEKEE